MIGFVIMFVVVVVLLLSVIILAFIGERSSWDSPLDFFSWSSRDFSTFSTVLLVSLMVMISGIWGAVAVGDYNDQSLLTIEHNQLIIEIEKIKESDGDLMLVERRVNDYNTKLNKCIVAEENSPAFRNFDLDFLKNDLGYISFVMEA